MTPYIWWLHAPDGTIVRKRDGSPFVYSSEDLATLGRKVLAKERSTKLSITRGQWATLNELLQGYL